MTRFIRFLTISWAAPVLVVAVALIVLGGTLIPSPASAKPAVEKTILGDLDCSTNQIAKFNGSAWVCATPDLGPKVVFVTSGTWKGDLKSAGGGVDGLDGADKLCQEAAAGPSSIVPPGFYIAWLSDLSTDAIDRLPDGINGFFRPDGALVAVDKADLTDGTLSNPISIDENGSGVADPRSVWSATADDGTLWNDFLHCKEFTVAPSGPIGGGEFTRSGLSTASDSKWTIGGAESTVICRSFLHLYCFQM